MPGPEVVPEGVQEGGPLGPDEARAAVRRVLESHAPCDTGYPGKGTCQICVGGHECADALHDVMVGQDPAVDWAPAIRDVLGLW